MTPDGLDAGMEQLQAGLRLTVANTIQGADGGMMSVDLHIRSIRDFDAGCLIDQIPVLRLLEETRSRLGWSKTEVAADGPLAAIVELLLEHDLLPAASMVSGNDQYAPPEDRGNQLLVRLRQRLSFAETGEFELAIEMVGEYATLTWCLGTMSEFMLDDRLQGTAGRDQIAAELSRAEEVIAGIIGRQLDVIVHHPKFRQLEGAWRGLYHLATYAGQQGRVRLSAFNLSKSELASLCRRDRLEHMMWQRMRRVWGRHRTIDLHDDAHWPDMPLVGHQPIGLLVGDYSFDTRSADDLDILRRIAGLARDLQAPVVVNHDDDGIDSAARATGLDQEALSDLRTGGDAQCLVLAAQAFLARPPHDAPTNSQQHELAYTEQIISSEELSWSGAALALAARVASVVDSGRWSSVTREDPSLGDMILACRIAHCLRLIARQCAADDADELQTVLQSRIDQLGADSSAVLFAEPRIVKALIRVAPPTELPHHSKGVLRYPRYFDGMLHLVLADCEGSREYSMALRVALYRRVSAGSGHAKP